MGWGQPVVGETGRVLQQSEWEILRNCRLQLRGRGGRPSAHYLPRAHERAQSGQAERDHEPGGTDMVKIMACMMSVCIARSHPKP